MKNIDLKNQSLETLVIQFQTSKDNASFGELYNRFYGKLFIYCKKIMGNHEDAYDITTNTFIKVSEKINQLTDPELFPSWLFRIAHNLCMDNKKQIKKNRTIEIETQYNLVDDTSGQEAQIEKEAELLQLEILLDQLDPESKEILIEKYLNKKSVNELQNQYNLSASAIKMRLARARNKVATLAQGISQNY